LRIPSEGPAVDWPAVGKTDQPIPWEGRLRRVEDGYRGKERQEASQKTGVPSKKKKPAEEAQTPSARQRNSRNQVDTKRSKEASPHRKAINSRGCG
jgi:hypothetical protein